MFFVRNSALITLLVGFVFGQHNFDNVELGQEMVWCATNEPEMYKCRNFTVALERDQALFNNYFLNVSCHFGYDQDECMRLIDEGKAHAMMLDAGEVYTGGRHHSLVPIMQEGYDGGFTQYHAVAVIKKDTLHDVSNLRQLKGKKACFAWVGNHAGWTLPIYTLQREGGMDITDCNNHVKTATDFFGPSCAVNALVDKYNPIGDNSDKLCSLCVGKVPGEKCTPKDPYMGFEGAFRCLLEAGEIAFLKHTTVNEMVNSGLIHGVTADQFELLCKDGSRQPISEYRQCHWGLVQSHALVVSSARTNAERRRYKKFFTQAVNLYASKSKGFNGTNVVDDRYRNQNNPYNNNRFDAGRSDDRYDNRFYTSTTERFEYDRYEDRQNNETQFYEKFDLFESRRYGKRLNLMFQDTTRYLAPIDENNQNFQNYLGSALDQIYGVRACPVSRMTLCVTSDAEMDKCIKMRTALKAQLIKPEMLCLKAHSHIDCMRHVNSGQADVVVLDASDVYTGGLKYDLLPFMSEIYDLGQPEYYVVAVAKEEDPDTELTYLRKKNTCHSGINTAAGWVYPMAYLISNGWIRPYGCDSIRAAAEYFTKSCVPGAISNEYNTGVPYDNLCDLCRGSSFRYCRRDASEDYYGSTGAFRCLVEGGGHVAFVKHTTVLENTGGKKREWWARNTLPDDFELLCPDGTRAEINEYKRCNLGKVKANAIVTRGGHNYNATQLNAYINLFTYAQQFYGRRDANEFSFSLFYSNPPYHDLIFSDATRELRLIPGDRRWFDAYLGADFLRARRITDCHAGFYTSSTLRCSGLLIPSD
ncbi:melanotransferrin isoform X2 [Toxorhynchites rutilus septentrionalis]|uniref:melanotransferrin isoform X2 n=1 Tax=Toxorhynchites rutilus septentrionalis TaxID=329112 RepID=UPI0024788874|nr:melanotransferrin isoform X2 [Toxorhynchites rutilus septentrionalis]